VSELMRPSPSPRVREWVNAQAPGEPAPTTRAQALLACFIDRGAEGGSKPDWPGHRRSSVFPDEEEGAARQRVLGDLAIERTCRPTRAEGGLCRQGAPRCGMAAMSWAGVPARSGPVLRGERGQITALAVFGIGACGTRCRALLDIVAGAGATFGSGESPLLARQHEAAPGTAGGGGRPRRR
jgi:hypothetical protein